MPPQSPLIVTLTQTALHVHTADATPLKVPDPPVVPTALCAYSDSTHLAEGTSSGAVLLREVPTLERVATLPPSSPSRVTALAVSHTARLIAAGHKDGTITLYTPPSHPSLSTSFSSSSSSSSSPPPSASTTATATTTASSPASCVHGTLADSGAILGLAFPPLAAEPRHLAAVTAQHVTLFSPTTFRRHARLVLPSAPSRSYSRSPAAAAKLTTAAFSPLHPSLLAAADDTGGVTVWDVAKHVVARSNTSGRNNATPVADTPPHARFVATLRTPATALAFAPDGTLLVAGFDKHVRVFDAGLTRLLFTAPAPAPVSALACSSITGSFISKGTNTTSTTTNNNNNNNNSNSSNSKCVTRIALGLTDGSVALAALDLGAKTLQTTQQIRVPAPDSASSLAIRTVVLPAARPPLAERRRTRRQPVASHMLPPSAANAATPIPPTASKNMNPISKHVPGAPVLESLEDVLARLSSGSRSGGGGGGGAGGGIGGTSLFDEKGGGGSGGGNVSGVHGHTDGSGVDDAHLFSPVSKRTPPPPSSPPSMTSLGSSLSNSVTADLPRPRRSRTVDAIPTPSQAASRASRIREAEDFPSSHSNSVLDDAGDSNGMIGNAGRASPLLQLSSGELPTLRKALTDAPGSRVDVGGVRDMVGASPRRARLLEAERRAAFAERSSPPGARLPSGDARIALRRSPDGSGAAAAAAARAAGGGGRRAAALLHDRLGLPLGSGTSPGSAFQPPIETTAPIALALSSSPPTPLPVDTMAIATPGAVHDVAGTPSADGSVRKEGDVASVMRDMVKMAMDELRTDLRSDILAIHSEMVMMEARRTEELRAMIIERDEGMARMREELARLRGDNERLRVKYGLR